MMKMGKTYRRVMLMVVLLSAVLSAHAYQPAAVPASWRTTPTMSTCPTYQFRSTSSFTPIVGQTSYTTTQVYSPGGPYKAKKEGEEEWGYNPEEDGQDPVGQWDTPVGEPLIMLVMALAMIIVKSRKTASLKVESRKQKGFKTR